MTEKQEKKQKAESRVLGKQMDVKKTEKPSVSETEVSAEQKTKKASRVLGTKAQKSEEKPEPEKVRTKQKSEKAAPDE